MKDRHIKMRLHNAKAVAYTKIYGVTHPIRPQILCASFRGRQYADSPRNISEMLHELHPEIDIIWALNSNDDPYGIIPSYVKKVKYNSKEYYQSLATSFCFIANNEMRPNIAKRKGQYFIQTWHGDRSFKKVLYDDLDDWNDTYRANVVRDDAVTDICLAASDYGERVYRSAFRYNGEILRVGMPRNDQLLNVSLEKAEIIKKKLNVDTNSKLIMYAPTFRDDKLHESCEVVDIEALVEWLCSETGDTWKGLYRAHSLGKGIGSNGRVLDVSDYPDMADLLLISDAVITDYSSVSGDYMLMDRPMVLALFDLDDYTKSSRQLSVSLDEVGLPIAKNMNELHSLMLKSINQKKLLGRDQAMNYYGVTESGDSTRTVVNLIIERFNAFFSRED